MKAIITGANGTIGSALCELLQAKGFDVMKWNRYETPITDYQVMENFVKSVRPDVLFHLAIASQPSQPHLDSWIVNYEWTSELAWITRLLGIKFLLTSTNLVFSGNPSGPYTTDSIADATSGYGYEKRKAEERIMYQNPDAFITRLGWQIGEYPGSNNMIDYLDRQMSEFGEVRANINWKPAASFLKETCKKILEITLEYSPGLYMIDSNKKWNFFEIATALNELYGGRWKIVQTEGDMIDNRLVDERVKMITLDKQLRLAG